jgi:myo-inositol-1(or 4)-monophosphatase
MRSVIREAFPDHGILGEEFGWENESAPYCWALDPIDGTRAFITGRPVFGTLIALLREGTPILGLIDQPILRERWLAAPDQPLRFTSKLGGAPGTRACPSLAEAELSCTTPDMLGDWHPRWQRLAGAVRRTSWGGDCYAYGLLALGQIDVIAERDLKIWDWAALVPVVEAAGGRMTDWSGRALTRSSPGDVLAVGAPSLLAPAVDLLTATGGT